MEMLKYSYLKIKLFLSPVLNVEIQFIENFF